MKINRLFTFKEVKKLKDMKNIKTNDYAFYFVCLFCKAVCENMDSKGKTSLTGKPQLYVDGDNITLFYKIKKGIVVTSTYLERLLTE